MPYLVHLLSSSERFGHEFLGFTGFRIDLLQSVHQFQVFGTERVDQRTGLSGERLDRLSIVLAQPL